MTTFWLAFMSVRSSSLTVFAVRGKGLSDASLPLGSATQSRTVPPASAYLGGGEEVQVVFADGEVVAHLEGGVRVDVRSTVYNDGTSVNV